MIAPSELSLGKVLARNERGGILKKIGKALRSFSAPFNFTDYDGGNPRILRQSAIPIQRLQSSPLPLRPGHIPSVEASMVRIDEAVEELLKPYLAETALPAAVERATQQFYRSIYAKIATRVIEDTTSQVNSRPGRDALLDGIQSRLSRDELPYLPSIADIIQFVKLMPGNRFAKPALIYDLERAFLPRSVTSSVRPNNGSIETDIARYVANLPLSYSYPDQVRIFHQLLARFLPLGDGSAFAPLNRVTDFIEDREESNVELFGRASWEQTEATLLRLETRDGPIDVTATIEFAYVIYRGEIKVFATMGVNAVPNFIFTDADLTNPDGLRITEGYVYGTQLETGQVKITFARP